MSKKFKDYATQKGIKLEYTMSYSPAMNGKSERMNQTILNMIRTKIIDWGIPKTLWGEAAKCSAYELNRSPTSAIPDGSTPSLIWHGRNDISKLRVFGCRAWFNKLPRDNKINSRAKRCIMLGYCGGGYRLWLPTEEIVVQSRDVRFYESVLELKSTTVHPATYEDNEKEATEPLLSLLLVVIVTSLLLMFITNVYNQLQISKIISCQILGE